MATCIPVLYTQSSEAIIKTFGQMFQWHFVILGFMYWAWAIIVRSENFMSFNFSQMNVKSVLNQCFELSYVTEDILTNQLLFWHRYCGASLQQLFAPSVQLCSAQTSLLQVDITLNTSIISLMSKCRNLRETVEMSQSEVLLQCCVVCGEMRERLWLAGDGGAPAPECEGAQSSSVFTELSWGKQVQQQHKSVVIISDKVWHQLMMNN